MNRKFVFAPNEYYHIYQRGVERRDVFLDHGDYWRFLSLLYLCNSSQPIHRSDFPSDDKAVIFSTPRSNPLTAIGAYCLLPNHFHLLLREITEGGISKFMQKLITAYSMYFNKRRQRSGALFGGSFGARHVKDDIYLQYLYAYIHLNPIKINDPESWGGKRIANFVNAVEFLNNYRYSSYQFYLKMERLENKILSAVSFPDYFLTRADFTGLLNDWINFEFEI